MKGPNQIDQVRYGRKELKAAARTINSVSGIALIMVLWVLTILVVLAFSFSFVTRTETHATLFFKEAIEEKFLAEAGFERGVMELFHRGFYKNKQAIQPGHEPLRVDGTEYRSQLGNHYYSYRVQDESGKININTLNDASGIILRNLLLNRGVSVKDAETIVDSVLDWKDKDELHRLNGAESDYYMSLPNPYKSKNALFDTVEELVMVKGVTPAILYGGDNKPGIIDFLTVSSKAGGININSAPKEVLAALPNMNPEKAQQVVAARGPAEFRTIEDIRLAAGEGYVLTAPYISVSESNIYSIESKGYKKEDERGYTVKATIILEGNGKYRCMYYKSPAGLGRVQ